MIGRTNFNAIFCPGTAYKYFSQKDFDDIYDAMSHLSDRNDDVEMEMNFEEGEINLDFSMRKNNDRVSPKEMIPMFSKYVRMVGSSIERTAEIKKTERRESIASLEILMRSL